MAGAAAVRHDARHLQEALGSAFAATPTMQEAQGPQRGLMALIGARRALSQEDRARAAAARAFAARLVVGFAEDGLPALEVGFAGHEGVRLPGEIAETAMPLACGVAGPAEGEAALILADAGLIDLLVDLHCGGAARCAAGRLPVRAASGMEVALARRLFEIVLAQAGPLLPDGAAGERPVRIETDPRRLQAAGLPERVTALRFEIVHGERRARLTLLLPAARGLDMQARPDACCGADLAAAVAAVPARLDALLAPATLRLTDLGRLAPGDTLVLPFGEDEPARLVAGGLAIGRGALGRSAGRLGVALELSGREAGGPAPGAARIIRPATAGPSGGQA